MTALSKCEDEIFEMLRSEDDLQVVPPSESVTLPCPGSMSNAHIREESFREILLLW